jgi:capsular exopolysaccharide synthesis family protein
MNMNGLRQADHAGTATGIPRLLDLRDDRQWPHLDGDLRVELGDTRLVAHPEADPVFVEQYRRLGAAVHGAQVANGIRSVMVTSAVEGEGKTFVAANLAWTLSRSFGKRVLLVDGDMRNPSIHRLLRIEGGIGLRRAVQQPGDRPDARMLSPTLSVIAGGAPDPDPVAWVVSEAAQRFLREARDEFDCVVVDTPPALAFPDASLFVASLDVCLMVVRAAATASPAAARAVEAIGAPRILGVVLNQVAADEIARGYGYYGARGGSWPLTARR